MEGIVVSETTADYGQVEVGDKVDRDPLHVDCSEMRTLLFDCDDTLYGKETGVDAQIKKNIMAYMERELNIPHDEVQEANQKLYEKCGTTLRGLQKLYNVDPNHYWAYVHGTLDYAKLIPRNENLAKVLRSLPQRKLVFTNANREHAEACIRQLGLEGIFEDIVDVRAMDYENKPSAAAYRTALRMAGEDDPSKVLFFDDSEKNLVGGRKFGMHTVRVAPDAKPTAFDVALLSALEELPNRLPDLWKFDPDAQA